jgi:AraC-like DNA-binding protein
MGSEILLGLKDIVKIRIIDFCRAERPFIHADRILDFNVFIYIVSGYMKIWENGKEYVVREKHAFFLKKGLHHLGKSEIPEGTTWYYMHFYDGQDFENSRPMNDYNALTFSGEFSAEDYNQYIQLPKLLEVNNPKLIERKLNSLCQLYKSSDDFRIAFLSYGAMEVFFDLYIQERNRTGADKADIIIRKVISFLENNISKKVNSKDISSYIGMNYNYIGSLFKQKTGMSIQSYHTKIRINEAAGLLRSSCLNVSEVSDRMGFSDPLYFSHVFRKVTGYPPSEYIKQSYYTAK